MFLLVLLWIDYPRVIENGNAPSWFFVRTMSWENRVFFEEDACCFVAFLTGFSSPCESSPVAVVCSFELTSTTDFADFTRRTVDFLLRSLRGPVGRVVRFSGSAGADGTKSACVAMLFEREEDEEKKLRFRFSSRREKDLRE